MRLYFIRHGQSENNARWNGAGYDGPRKPDPDLTEIGRRQAERVAQFVAQRVDAPTRDSNNRAGFGITHLYCSLMLRAAETGTIISAATGVPLVAWREIHEVGGMVRDDEETGAYIGLPGPGRDFFQRRFPALQLPETLDGVGWWNQPYEEPEERLPRAHNVLAQLRARHGDADDRVAFVSHGGFYNYLTAALLGLESREKVWVALSNCGISRFDFFDDGSVGLMYSNRSDHLPPDLITW